MEDEIKLADIIQKDFITLVYLIIIEFYNSPCKKEISTQQIIYNNQTYYVNKLYKENDNIITPRISFINKIISNENYIPQLVKLYNNYKSKTDEVFLLKEYCINKGILPNYKHSLYEFLKNIIIKYKSVPKKLDKYTISRLESIPGWIWEYDHRSEKGCNYFKYITTVLDDKLYKELSEPTKLKYKNKIKKIISRYHNNKLDNYPYLRYMIIKNYDKLSVI